MLFLREREKSTSIVRKATVLLKKVKKAKISYMHVQSARPVNVWRMKSSKRKLDIVRDDRKMNSDYYIIVLCNSLIHVADLHHGHKLVLQKIMPNFKYLLSCRFLANSQIDAMSWLTKSRVLKNIENDWAKYPRMSTEEVLAV